MMKCADAAVKCALTTALWRARFAAAVMAVIFFGGLAAPASAQAPPPGSLPATKLLSAPLIPVAEGWTRYGAPVTHVDGVAHYVGTPPEMVSLARSLGAERADVLPAAYVQNVYDYVRNNIATEFRFGLGKGGRGALIDQSGTAFDQAELMVKLLELKAGVATPALQPGTITLTPAQFGKWTGFVKDLNPGAQTFNIDARAACEFLADGAIPAAFGAVTSCSNLSGDLTTNVTVAHVWVTVGGLVLDPAYKRNILRAPIDLATAANCGGAGNCATQAKTAALPALTALPTPNLPGGDPRFPAYAGVNVANLSAKLTEFAASIETSIRAGHLEERIETVAGMPAIDADFIPTTESGAPSHVAVSSSWGDKIPDQYRTKISIKAKKIAQTILYVDEISGRSVRMRLGNLYIDQTLIPTNDCADCTLFDYDWDTGYFGNILFDDAEYITVAIDHPYRADDPAYADELIRPVMYNTAQLATIVVGLGDAGPSTQSFYDKKISAEQAPTNGVAGLFWLDSPGHSAGILALQSEGVQLASGATSAGTTSHHTLGLMLWEDPYLGNGEALTLATSVSVRAHDGNSAGRAGTFQTISVLNVMAETPISDSWPNGGAPYRFRHTNSPGNLFVNTTGGNVGDLIPLLTNYNPVSKDRLAAEGAANSSSNFIVARDASICASFLPGMFPQPDICVPNNMNDGTFVYSPTTSAYLIGNLFKGAMYGPPVPGTPKVPDKTARDKKYADIDLATGALRLTPDADITTGAGDFPQSLSFQRYFDSSRLNQPKSSLKNNQEPGQQIFNYIASPNGASAPGDYRDAASGPPGYSQAWGPIGGGWFHNWEISAALTSDVGASYGRGRAIDAAWALAAIQTLYELHRSESFADKLTGIFVADWLLDHQTDNVVQIILPPKTEYFSKLPSENYSSPLGSGSRVDATVVKSNLLSDFEGRIFYGYSNISINYTLKDRSIIQFRRLSVAGNEISPTDQFATFAGSGGLPLQWLFPDGVRLNFEYDPLTTRTPILKKVRNNLGRYLEFSYANTLNSVLSGVKDENQRTVSIARSNCPNWSGGVAANMGSFEQLGCNTFSISRPGISGPIIYDYTQMADSADLASFGAPNYRLRRWFTPSDSNIAYQSVRYDTFGLVSELTDALAHTTRFYAGGVLGSENNKTSYQVDPQGFVTVNVFDGYNSLLKSVDARGFATLYEYDSAGRKVREENPEHDFTTYAYDLRSNLTDTTRHSKPGQNAFTATTHKTYYEAANVEVCPPGSAACNSPVSETDALAHVTTYEWNATTGQVTKITKPADVDGGIPEAIYTYQGLAAQGSTTVSVLAAITQRVTPTTATVSTFGYQSGSGLITSSVVDSGVLSLQTTYGYNPYGDLTSITNPLGQSSNYLWDPARRLTYTIAPDPDGAGQAKRTATHWVYNRDGAVLATETGETTSIDPGDFVAITRKTSTYDAAGNRRDEAILDISMSPPTVMALTQYKYDALDRLECAVVRMNPALFGSIYDDNCTPTGANNLADRLTQNTYDPAGNITEVKRGGNGAWVTESYTFTANGQRASVKDGRNNTTTYVYDGFDRIEKLIYPVAASGLQTSDPTDYERYEYDANNNRISFRRRSGHMITYVYDALNHMVEKHIPDAPANDVYYRYDLLDRLKSATYASATGTGTYLTYDGAGRQTADQTNGWTIASSYNAASNRTGLSLSDGYGTLYEYDAAGRMTVIRDAAGTEELVRFQYDNLGRRTQLIRANGGSATYAYDRAGRLKALIQAGGAGQPVLDQTISYNPASQIVASAQANDNYAYRGKPKYVTDIAYDGRNRDGRITALSGGYDARQNVANDGERAMVYDVENRLTHVGPTTGSGVQMDLQYDPAGRLFSTTTTVAGVQTPTYFRYDADRLVGEYGSSNAPQRHYVYGPGVDEPLVWHEGVGVGVNADRRWLHSDRQGSIAATSNKNGVVTAYTYGPYGEPSDWGALRFRYTGQIALQEARLYHYKARVYDPVMGRFLQTDPVGYGDGLNLYGYVGGDPINRSDPTGNAGCDVSLGDACSSILADQNTALAAVREARAGLAQLKSEQAELKSGNRSELSAGAQATAGTLQATFGSSKVGSSVDGNLGKVEGFLADPGRANGGKYDYRAPTTAELARGAGAYSAFVNPQNKSSVAIVAGVFAAQPSYDRAQTLIHEPLHIFGMSGVPWGGQTEAYRGDAIALGQSVGGTARAVGNNPDSYACFVIPTGC